MSMWKMVRLPAGNIELVRANIISRVYSKFILFGGSI